MTGLAELDVGRAQGLDEGRHDALDQGGRVDRRRGAFLDLDGRLGGLMGLRQRDHAALDAGDELLADRFAERPRA